MGKLLVMLIPQVKSSQMCSEIDFYFINRQNKTFRFDFRNLRIVSLNCKVRTHYATKKIFGFGFKQILKKHRKQRCEGFIGLQMSLYLDRCSMKSMNGIIYRKCKTHKPTRCFMCFPFIVGNPFMILNAILTLQYTTIEIQRNRTGNNSCRTLALFALLKNCIHRMMEASKSRSCPHEEMS